MEFCYDTLFMPTSKYIGQVYSNESPNKGKCNDQQGLSKYTWIVEVDKIFYFILFFLKIGIIKRWRQATVNSKILKTQSRFIWSLAQVNGVRHNTLY